MGRINNGWSGRNLKSRRFATASKMMGQSRQVLATLSYMAARRARCTAPTPRIPNEAVHHGSDYFGSHFEAESTELSSAEVSSGIKRKGNTLPPDDPRSYAAGRVLKHTNWQKARQGIADALVDSQLPAAAGRVGMQVCEASSCQSTCEILAIGLMGNRSLKGDQSRSNA